MIMNTESTAKKGEKLSPQEIHELAIAPLPTFNIICPTYRYGSFSISAQQANFHKEIFPINDRSVK